MAVYLPLISVRLVGRGLREGAISVAIALATVGVVLFVAVRYGKAISRVVAHQSDEIILLSTFGLVLPLAAAYVLLLAVLGPILARFVGAGAPTRQ